MRLKLNVDSDLSIFFFIIIEALCEREDSIIEYMYVRTYYIVKYIIARVEQAWVGNKFLSWFPLSFRPNVPYNDFWWKSEEQLS